MDSVSFGGWLRICRVGVFVGVYRVAMARPAAAAAASASCLELYYAPLLLSSVSLALISMSLTLVYLPAIISQAFGYPAHGFGTVSAQ